MKVHAMLHVRNTSHYLLVLRHRISLAEVWLGTSTKGTMNVPNQELRYYLDRFLSNSGQEQGIHSSLIRALAIYDWVTD
jgi:hypothetical protein